MSRSLKKGSLTFKKRGRSRSRSRSKNNNNSEFMYYPDITDSNFYPYLWSKQEFIENKSPAQEYHQDKKKKMDLLKKICTPNVIKLKSYQVFLRNYLSPETPYNSILVYHGIGTGKCLLPETAVYLNGSLMSISEIWNMYKSSESFTDLESGEWSLPNDEIMINSYDEQTNKMIEYPVKHLYRQKVDEKIVTLELEDGQKLRLTKQHHLLTENGWSNDFKKNKFVSVPNILKNETHEESIGDDLAYFLSWQIAEGHERSTSSPYCTLISNNERDVLDKLKIAITNIGEKYDLNINNPRIFEPKDRTNYLQLNSRDYRRFLESKGYKWGNLSKSKTIPDIVMRSTREEIKIFLRAYFDAESHVNVKNSNIEISSASNSVIIKLQHLLKNFGVSMFFKKVRKCATNGTKIYRDYYTGFISSQDLRNYSREIGYTIGYKKQNLEKICKTKVNPNKCRYNVNHIIKDIKKVTKLPNEVFINKNIIYLSTEPSLETIKKIIINLKKVLKDDYDLPARDIKKYQLDDIYLQSKIDQLESIINNEISLVKIKKVTEENHVGYVYDLEIENHHNFVAGGIICHNTCSGVVIAEGLKEMTEKYNKKIYVIAGSSLQVNFQKTLYNVSREKNSKYPGSLQCTKTTYYIPPKKKEDANERRAREKAIQALQRKHYVYMGYTAFVNFVNKEVIGNGYDLSEFFSNSVFVVDEAHNLIARSSSSGSAKEEEKRKTRQKLFDIFKQADNTKLILLTATPITNEINDIVVLMNLLRANDNRSILRPEDLSTDGSRTLTRENLNIQKFNNYIKGYISYVRGAHPSVFPTETQVNEYQRTVRANRFGDKLATSLPSFKELALVGCQMSYFHFWNYYRELMRLEKNSVGGIRSSDAQGDQRKMAAATAMYPLEDRDDSRLGGFEIDDFMIKEKSKGRIEKYKYRTKESFFDVDLKNEKYLHDQSVPKSSTQTGYPLSKYSTKFYRMLKDVINNFGINFIFTRYKTSVGTIPISLILEQNGYVRYHRNLGKPNEFTGKYREGVSNQLNIRNPKYRCVCGYLDTEHNSNFSLKSGSKPDYSSPKRHRFLQGTYIRVDGDTSDEFDKYYQAIVTSRENRYGEIIKVIVGGKNMREGIDLRYVRSVHIMNPWHNLIQIEQTIGRAIRLCSHSALDSVDEMNVRVFKYVAIPPQEKMPRNYSLENGLNLLEDTGNYSLEGVKFNDRNFWLKNLKSNDPSDWMTADEFIYARASNKDFNIKYAERLMKKAAVDCHLNAGHNLAFPGDRDGSRKCDYTKCDYECNYSFQDPKKPNLDTYDLYFMEPKVQDTQEMIGDLFTRNWALTLKSIVELIRKQDSKINRDVIYLALDRMLGDPPRVKPLPVLDVFGRYGYLIYRHPFYIYQPNEVADENLPTYYRKIPSQGKKDQIDMREILQPVRKVIKMSRPISKESPSSRLGNVTSVRKDDYENRQIKFTSEVESIVASIYRTKNPIIIAFTLDYFTKKQHEYLIRTRIEEWVNGDDESSNGYKIKNRSPDSSPSLTFKSRSKSRSRSRSKNKSPKKKGMKDPFTAEILKYYLENYLIGHPGMKYGELDSVSMIPQGSKARDGWVYNISGIFWKYNPDQDKWEEINEDDKAMDSIRKQADGTHGPRFEQLRRPLSERIYGFLYDDNKKKDILFKVTDIQGQQTKKKLYSEDVNIKTQAKGQVCNNYSNDKLEALTDRLKIKHSENLQRNQLCQEIELDLRHRDSKDPKTNWFLNFFNYKRKFNKLEESDIRSLYNFYQN